MKYDVKNMKSYLRKNDISKVELMGVMGIIIISKDVIEFRKERIHFCFLFTCTHYTTRR